MYSEEHRKFLRKIKMNRILTITIQVLIVLIFIIIWQILADKEIINPFISSSPKQILNTIISLHNDNNLYQHIGITIYETFLSFSLGTIIGCIVAIILWWYPFLAKVFDPFLTVLNSLPKVALGPIIIIWSGAGIQSIIIMALLISVIITIINVYQGFIEIDYNKMKLMQSFKASKWQILIKLLLPGSFASIISTLKINVSMSLIGVIMGEFLVSKKGIGYLIMYGSQVFNLNLVMTGVIILCLVATLMYYLVNYIEKKVIKNK